MKRLLATTLVVLAAWPWAGAADWPMWRRDAGRTAASPQELPNTLHLQWVRALPHRKAVFHYDPRSHFDTCYLPVVTGKRLFVGLEAPPGLLALATESGEELWRFYTDGPLRFAPVAADGRVYFGADDGCLYCLDASTGKLLWKFDGAPSPRKMINHGRLTSNWPVSGGPVLHRGKLVFTCGIWPIDGTCIYALAPSTGKVLWSRDLFAHLFLGHMAASGSVVIVPSGGKHPHRFDIQTGAYLGRGGGGFNTYACDVAATERLYICGHYFYSLDRGGQRLRCYANAQHEARDWLPVLSAGRIYGFNDGILKVFRFPTDQEPDKKNLVPLGAWWVNARPDYAWSRDTGVEMKLPQPASLPEGWYPDRLFIKAGSRLFAGGDGAVVGITEPLAPGGPRVAWVGKVEGKVRSIIAADDKLFVATEAGKLYCFGASPREPLSHPAKPGKLAPEPKALAEAEKLLALSGQESGYALVLGLRDSSLVEALAARSRLRLVGVDGDAVAVEKVRRSLDGHGLLGRRADVLCAKPLDFGCPPYVANLVVSEAPERLGEDPARMAGSLFEALRPYGGTACLALGRTADAFVAAARRLPGASVERKEGMVIVRRGGALPGASDWTHERCDVAPSLCSPDTAARPPFSILWLGGPAAEWHRTYAAFIPPGLEIVNGLYIMQGHGLLTAIDAYTGRLVWEAQVPKVQYYGYYGSVEPGKLLPYPENPERTWQGDHRGQLGGTIEVARLSGNALNTVATPEGIYAAVAEQCWVVAPASGKRLRTIPVPFNDPHTRKPLCWGALRVCGEELVAAFFDPEDIRAAFPAWMLGNDKNKQRLPMRWLAAMEKASGKLLWKRKARDGFLNWGIAVGNGRLFALDTVIPSVVEAYRRTGHRTAWDAPRLLALDLATGKELWQRPLDVLVTNPVCSPKHDIVVLPAREPVFWETGGWVRKEPPRTAPRRGKKAAAPPGVMMGYRGADGKLLWRVSEAVYGEPLMLHERSATLITRHGLTFDLRTGHSARRASPLTGQAEPWSAPRGGCNFLLGSANLVTWRTAYLDLATHGGVFPIRGMRSGCTPSIIPAAGVLSLLNYSAGYPSDELRSALVLAHRPGAVNWGRYLSAGADAAPRLRVGINLAAPGDTVGPGGIVWLAARPQSQTGRRRRKSATPVAAGIEGEALRSFSFHPARFDGQLAAVASSGVEGVRRVEVELLPKGTGQPRLYRVRLVFAEPQDLEPGRRVFDVAVQGKKVRGGFDIVAAAGAPRRAAVLACGGTRVESTLVVELKAGGQAGRPPLLCGIEAVAVGH